MEKRKEAVRRVLKRTANEPFMYGALDCMRFANEFIKEITGRDLSAGFEYASQREAYKIIKEAGSLEQLCCELAGEPSPVEELQIGDPVLMDLPTIGETMGIMLNGKAVAKTIKGTTFIPLHHCVKGWAI